MIESINNIYETIFDELKNYLQDNSLYNPYVYKKEPTGEKLQEKNQAMVEVP